ncbi:MAG: hypothetical protein QNJ47_23520 [Nostocaceae cyanobacterium]|nr:hypothetical protein [Nostocaceae cyanobacterium]
MINKISSSQTLNQLMSQVDIELLEALLEPEDGTYPWNPADADSEAYFQQLEEQFPMQDVLDEELGARSQDFYSQLDNLWSGLSSTSHYNDTTKAADVVHLQETLQAHFATLIPQDWLVHIAQKAWEMFKTQQSVGEQLVQCVQTVLPTWSEDDLLVLARPFAYAMRSPEEENSISVSVIDKLADQDWTTLSEIEQARASLAIAYYALNQLKKSPEATAQ